MSNFQLQPVTAVPNAKVTGNPNALAERLGEAPVSEWLPRYSAMSWSGYTYSLSVSAAAAITAYIGAAGGTPQIAVWNPAGSGKNLWPIAGNFGNVVAASAAGTAAWALWYGQTAAITQATLTTPTNQLTLNASGSVAKGYTNIALTASTALANLVPLGSYYWATAAGAALVTPAAPIEIPGYVCIPPGSMMALGGSAALTSATWTGALIWLELPI